MKINFQSTRTGCAYSYFHCFLVSWIVVLSFCLFTLRHIWYSNDVLMIILWNLIFKCFFGLDCFFFLNLANYYYNIFLQLLLKSGLRLPHSHLHPCQLMIFLNGLFQSLCNCLNQISHVPQLKSNLHESLYVVDVYLLGFFFFEKETK